MSGLFRVERTVRERKKSKDGLIERAAAAIRAIGKYLEPEFQYFAYRPAKGFVCIFSRRRQMRKQLTKALPRLRSGRQWRKFRKALKRDRGFAFSKIPSFYAASR